MRSRPVSHRRWPSRWRATRAGWLASAPDSDTPDARGACAAVAVSGAGQNLYVLVTRKGSLTYETNQANSGDQRP